MPAVRGRNEFGQAGDQRGERTRGFGLPNFPRRARGQRFKAGRDVGVGYAGSRLGWPLGDILQRVAIRDVRIADGQPAGPATPGFIEKMLRVAPTSAKTEYRLEISFSTPISKGI